MRQNSTFEPNQSNRDAARARALAGRRADDGGPADEWSEFDHAGARSTGSNTTAAGRGATSTIQISTTTYSPTASLANDLSTHAASGSAGERRSTMADAERRRGARRAADASTDEAAVSRSASRHRRGNQPARGVEGRVASIDTDRHEIVSGSATRSPNIVTVIDRPDYEAFARDRPLGTPSKDRSSNRSARTPSGGAVRPGSARQGTPSGGIERRQPASVYHRRRLAVLGLATLLVLGMVWAVSRVGGSSDEVASAANNEPVAATTVPDASATVAASASDDEAVIDSVACQLGIREVKKGDTGDGVKCVQMALAAVGLYEGEINGTFDSDTKAAAERFQASAGLYVDGIVGKNTADELGIWPGDESFIIRTPAPAPGATDLWGMPLSSVASAGDDAPPLPADAGQGTGKRVVYDRSAQRVWAVDSNERIVRSYLVSGSRFRNEVPGVHKVYSKSQEALGYDLKAKLPYMVRYTKTERGAIGFHAIPSWIASGDKLQTEDELGEKLSGGCTRQALKDAQFMWAFADVGTRIIVL